MDRPKHLPRRSDTDRTLELNAANKRRWSTNTLEVTYERENERIVQYGFVLLSLCLHFVVT